MNHRVAILGVGLIGGSLALAFKERTNCSVVGFDTSAETINQALSMDVVDEGYTSLELAAVDADYIFIAVPVGQIGNYINQLVEIPLKKGVLDYYPFI